MGKIIYYRHYISVHGLCSFLQLFFTGGKELINYRMAQPTQWAPAILDYMKKAKSSISTVVLSSNSNSSTKKLSELEFEANTTVDM